MENKQQSDALRLADEINANYFDITVQCCANELRRLHAESEQHMQELAAYRFTVENLRARVAELEAQLEEAPAHPAEGVPAQEVQAAIDRFDAYFRSANGVPPNARVSVPTAEWQELRAMLSTRPTQLGLDAQNPQNAVLDLSARPTVQIHWAREGDPNVLLHSVSIDMDRSCTTAGVLEAVAAAINDYAKQARKKYGCGIPWDTMNFTNVRMHSRDADGDGASIDGHSVIVVPNKPPHGITISHPSALASQAKQGGA